LRLDTLRDKAIDIAKEVNEQECAGQYYQPPRQEVNH
jgi:hypothetical protein